jgi:hypothetical protein
MLDSRMNERRPCIAEAMAWTFRGRDFFDFDSDSNSCQMNKRFFDLLAKTTRNAPSTNTAWVALEEIEKSGVLSSPLVNHENTVLKAVPGWLKTASESRKKVLETNKESTPFTKAFKKNYSTLARNDSNICARYPLARLDTLGGMFFNLDFRIMSGCRKRRLREIMETLYIPSPSSSRHYSPWNLDRSC